VADLYWQKACSLLTAVTEWYSVVYFNSCEVSLVSLELLGLCPMYVT